MDNSLPSEINIITLNCWGLKFNISKLRKERLEEIGRQLSQAHPAPHIVCLQEIWAHDDYLTIRRTLRALLPHGKFYYSGSFGAGLAILSHWPIEESTMSPYTLNGRPTAFWRGDWYVGKGIAQAIIRYGPDPDDLLSVFNTHTHAPYSSDTEDSYRVHREAQSWQLAKLLRTAAERGHLVVAAGDFNMTPLSTEHRILTAHAPVRDVWRVLHPQSSLGAVSDPLEKSRRRPTPTAAYNLTENGATSNSVYNTWRWPHAEQGRLGPGKPLLQVPPDTPDPHGKRLDYIFTSTAARELDDQGTIGGWVVRDARVGMVTRHPELGCSLSDHFSVEATLAFHTTTREGHAPSISNWPLPPGRLSILSAFRRSTPLLLQPSDGRTAEDAQNDGSENADPTAGGTFLSLPSPTPSTSRHSLPPHPHDDLDNDFDAQLLDSISPEHSDRQPFSSADYSALLGEIKLYIAREVDQVRLRTAHFCFWIFALFACCIAIWFIPTHSKVLSEAQNHGVNFVLLLLSSLGLAAGCIDGLMALLFFKGSEKRALKEFAWEVRNAKRIALGEAEDAVEEVEEGKYS
ncbi:phospholipase C type enzyme [Gnomoniopsis sp. IMI 355080]|nr:phospholipase C type enzyme [Gnomoniopsis sp. IMI 355080]